MKKTITKLVVRRETVKTLVDGELKEIVGGKDACKWTYFASSCNSGVVVPAKPPIE